MARYEGFHDKAGNEISFMEVLDLCKRSYDPLENSGTVQIAGTTMNVLDNRIEGGFAAFKIQKPGSWTAIVYRGSNDARDWVFNNIPGGLSGLLSFPPPQYGTGRDYAKTGNDNTLLVGHSLGGGIAMYAAAQEGLNAATIFPAPIQPTWLGFPPWPARGTSIQNYVSMGEILSMAAYGPTTHTRFGRDVWIETKGNPIDKHLLHNVVT
ncbi:MAG: alpha/beta hydrolase [Myxococcales bacterium]|nr:alpha/beta hydrolase [Myxococcales bacterium]